MKSSKLKLALLSLIIFKTTNLYASVYHILESSKLGEGLKTGYIVNSSLKQEGFTHCVQKRQIIQIANKYYLNGKDVVLIEIDAKRLSYPLRFDYVSAYKDLFPHIYGPINVTAITKLYRLKKNALGQYVSAEEIQRVGNVQKSTISNPNVTTTTIVPFSCNEGHELIKDELEQQCNKMNKRLNQYRILDCTPAGDDGGYVNYFAVSASGYCQ